MSQITSVVFLNGPSYKPSNLSTYIHYITHVQPPECVCVCAHTHHSEGSNPTTFTFSLWPNLRPVLHQRGLLLASRQFNHTYSTTPFSFPFHTASIPLRLHNSPLRAVYPVWVFAACWNDIISDLDKCLTVFPWVYNQTWGSVLQLWGNHSSSTWLRNYFLRRVVSHKEFAWVSLKWI